MVRVPRALALCCLAVLLALAGCASLARGGKGGELRDIQWRLSRYAADGGMKDVPSNAEVYADFARADVSGKALNSYSAPYHAGDDGALTIGEVTSTLMAGPPRLMEFEKAYFDALRSSASYTSDGATLRIFDDRGRELLRFVKTDTGLSGSWVVTGYNNGKQALISVASSSTITMEFGEGGRVTGNAGVSAFSGTYGDGGRGRVRIGNLRVTPKAGAPDLMRQEQAFLTALRSSAAYRVENGVLDTRDASGAVQFTAKRDR